MLLVNEWVALVQQMAKILSLDQSSRTSGFAVFENNELIASGHFSFTDDDFGDRLYKIRKKVISLIEQYQPDKVYFEDIQLQANVGNNVDTFKKLAEVFGVIYELLTEKNIDNEAVLASVWKSKLRIKGKDRTAQKKNAQEYVSVNYGYKSSQDECDAICIGAYGVINSKPPLKAFDWS